MNRPPTALAKDLDLPAGSTCAVDLTAHDVDAGSFDPDPGDAITLSLDPPGPFGLGTHTVVLTATDSHGASSSATAAVTVRDITPPTLSPPDDVIVEFTDIDGAPVILATPVAIDNCGVTSVTSDPASGQTFAIGTTVVTWTATDDAGNAATETSRVTVLGALGVKRNVVNELKTIAAVRGARTFIRRAIGLLQASVDDRLWIDQTHVRVATGLFAFELERRAVVALRRIHIASPAGSEVRSIQISAFIDRIVRTDRLLAEVAVEDAVAAGGDARLIANAREEIAEGDRAAEYGRPGTAITEYREAWSLAQIALKSRKESSKP